MSRYLYILILLSSLCITANAAKPANEDMQPANTWLIITLADGTEQTFVIPERLNITTTADSLFLSSSHFSSVYTLSKVRSYHFAAEGETPDAMDANLDPNRITYYSAENVVTIYGISPAQTIRVYKTNGMEVSPTLTRSANTVTISLSSLPVGVYIVSIPNSDFPPIKVIRQ